MTLYHGSYTAVEKPDLSFPQIRDKTDFGKGFYLTPFREQAERFCKRFIKKNGSAVVSSYEFLPELDETIPREIEALKFIPHDENWENYIIQLGVIVTTLEFKSYNEEWLKFIVDCRAGKRVDMEWDLIIGGVANDDVFDTLQLYTANLISVAEVIRRFQYHKPNIQYCFKTQSVIDDYLHFTGSEVSR